MDKAIPTHPFETFPREDLYIGLSRKQFFESVAAEFSLFAWRSEGSNAVKIPGLGSMPDADLQEIIPRILPGCKIGLAGDEIQIEHPKRAKPVRLSAQDPWTLYTYNLINGKNSLLQIALELADHTALPVSRAFAFTRGLFLTLVKSGVCLPTNNPFLG